MTFLLQYTVDPLMNGLTGILGNTEMPTARHFWIMCVCSHNNKVRKSNLITALDRPSGFQEVESPRIQDSLYMKVVRLSALSTGRLYPSGNIPGTHFC